jgi:hypothetical protein
MNRPHINLVIATPANSFVPDYVKSIVSMSRVFAERAISATFLTSGGSYIPEVREYTLDNDRDHSSREICEGRLTYDKIMWIDSDISWKPEDILKLYYSDKDIISGCYKFVDGTIAISKDSQSRMTVQELNSFSDPFKIDSCGFGFLCVKSGVFETFERPWFSTEDYMGEDQTWCNRAKGYGFEIWADPSVRVVHHKNVSLGWA